MPIDFKKELNEDQFVAATTRAKRALILAGAGSGKTRTLTHRVAWLLEQGVQPWRIMLLTFTNKAATEMLSRVETLTGIPRTEFVGGTFHSIGQRILRANADAVGIKRDFTIMDADDAEALFARCAKQIAPEFFKLKNSPKPRVFFDLASYVRNTRKPISEVVKDRMGWVPNAEELLSKFLDLYTPTKRDQNLCDYDDLLELFLELLKKNPEVCERYQKRFLHILIDEFQDTNTLQAEIVNALACEENSVMAVGDDAQCIYTWRGANYENITRFPEIHPKTVIHKIEINYRSTPQILEFANSILRTREEDLGYSKTMRATRGSGQKPFVIPATDSFDQARIVVSRILSLVNDEGISPNDIIVLYRAHRHAKELQLEFTRYHIPFLITSGLQFFQQAHVRDFVAILRFLKNPTDEVSFTRILALMEKVGTKTAAKILTLANKISSKKHINVFDALVDDDVLKKVPKAALDDFRDFAMTLQDMCESLKGAPTQPSNVDRIGNLELFDSPQKVPSIPQVESSTSVVATPSKLIRIGLDGWYKDFVKKTYSNWQQRQDDLESLIEFAEKFSSLEELLTQLTLLNSENTKKDVDSAARETAMIRLSTVHQAKGLEFPIVFVIGCAEEMFPTKRAIEDGEIDEERRLFYVACTRAKDELYLVHPITRMKYGKYYENGESSIAPKSRFIAEVSPETYSTLRVLNSLPRAYGTQSGFHRNRFSANKTMFDEYNQDIEYQSPDDPDETDPF